MSVTQISPPDTEARGAEELRDYLRQIGVSGTTRRALLMHMDRLPADLNKPHHHRLARAALSSLQHADRAQSFDLSRGRIAIVWRAVGTREVDIVMAALGHLLDGLPENKAVVPSQLVTLYDLPSQSAWLLDELTERRPTETVTSIVPLDPAILARLEQSLAQVDLSRFVRWRPIARLSLVAGGLARLQGGWEERFLSISDINIGLCPEYNLALNPWLLARLTRSFDRRMLTMSTGTKGIGGATAFSLHLNVSSILSAEFLRFDADLPVTLRGLITLNLRAADLAADPAAFIFARNFAHARGYRLLLCEASFGLLRALNLAGAGLDFVQTRLTPEIEAEPGRLRALAGIDTAIVLTGVDQAESLHWAARAGFEFVSGRALNLVRGARA